MLDTNLAEKLSSCLQDCKKISKDVSIPLVSSKIQEALDKLSEPMQLAIIGKISSSKSTLVNAILGKAEVVRTGQLEETFNVSWLKYGDTDSDIKVVFKNGKTELVPHKDWTYWTSHQEVNVLKTDVKYIEVPFCKEILKKVNIIDTPGLDAISKIDSENTIAFLKEVRPDAVIMLFTKSIAESTLNIVADFQNVGSNTFSLTPLNAIGVLAKVDTMWSSLDNPQKNVIEEAKRVIKSTLYDRYPEVRRTLFSILPVTALLGLASSTITEDDLQDVKSLAKVPDDTLLEMLSTPDFLIDESYKVELSIDKRTSLYEKFGLYGIFILTNVLKHNPNAELDDLKKELQEKSGFDKLLQTVITHFGDRAALIKSQNAIFSVIDACQKQSLSFNESSEELKIIKEINKKIVTTLLSIHEYQEWKYLSDIYENSEKYSETESSEFKALCGEYGSSVVEKLQLPCDDTIDNIINRIKDRINYWNRRQNIEINPYKASFYKIMWSSYNNLGKEVDSAVKDYKMAEATLSSTRQFLFGINK